jgi:hypothetical protein
MKTSKLFISCLALGLLSWSCAKNDKDITPTPTPTPVTVKSELTQNASEVSTAITQIYATKAYDMMSSSDTIGVKEYNSTVQLAPKSFVGLQKVTPIPMSEYQRIDMADIVGTYKSIVVTNLPMQFLGYPLTGRFIDSHFKKTSSTPTNALVLNIPERRIKNLNLLFDDVTETTTYEYSLSVTDYLRKFNTKTSNDTCTFKTSITHNGTNAGTYEFSYVFNGKYATAGSAKYTFPNGITAKGEVTESETEKSVTYTLFNTSKTLFVEQFTGTKATPNAIELSEKSYSISFGKVKLERLNGSKELSSLKVYLDGVQQTKATVEFVTIVSISDTKTKPSYDIRLTFDDGTTASLNTLAGTETLPKVRGLFNILNRSYIGLHLVNRAAFDIWSVNFLGQRPQ